MNAWIIKTETYDPKLALEIVADQRTKGYSAWIEDEHGKAVDEEAFRMNQTKPTKTTLREKGMTRCFFLASAMVALGILYVAGLWRVAPDAWG